LWRYGDGLFFEVPPLESDTLLTTLHPLLENVLQTVCRKLQEDSGAEQAVLTSELSFHGRKRPKIAEAISGLYGGCSNGGLPISVSPSIATFQTHNADAPLRLLRHPKKSSFKTTETPFSRNRWSVVKSASLPKGDTSKKRQSPHLHEIPTRSNESTNFANGPRTRRET
jgi:hypothetical protein